jgi:alkylhydroperoxidase family enzyme
MKPRPFKIRHNKVEEADIVDLRASGWEEQQIAECIHVTAMFACFNRVANAFGLRSQDLLSLISKSKE